MYYLFKLAFQHNHQIRVKSNKYCSTEILHEAVKISF